MTEAEWLTCDQPGPMLEFVRHRVGERKLRLFACGGCRWSYRRFPEENRGWGLLEAAERFADGRVSKAEFKIAKKRLTGFVSAAEGDGWWAADRTVRGVIWDILRMGERYPPSSNLVRMAAEANAAFADLARDIFGNPFRPIVATPYWFTSTAVALATSMYSSRDFAGMPIMADALEDAGCTEADILAHCRGPGPHVRGCWVADLVLGKS